MNSKYLKITIICTILIIVFFISRIDCFILRINSVTDLIDDDGVENNRLLFLYSGNICSTCAVGSFILNNANDAGITYILPSQYGEIDIENFKRSYPVKGKIIIAGKEINEVFERTCRCLKKKTMRNNVLVELSRKRKVQKVKMIG